MTFVREYGFGVGMLIVLAVVFWPTSRRREP